MERILQYITEGNKKQIESIIRNAEIVTADKLWNKIRPYINKGYTEELYSMLQRMERMYDNAIGPTPEASYRAKGDWKSVIESATNTNEAMNMLVGLDETNLSEDT